MMKYDKNNCKEKRFVSDVKIEHIDDIIDKILIQLENIDRNKRCILLHGMGKHPKSTYQRIKIDYAKRYDKIYYKSLIPKFLFFLRPFIASYAGLIEVNDLKIIKDLFFELMENSMVGLYIYSCARKDSIFNIFNSKPALLSFKTLETDCSFFSYTIDADNGASETGIVEILSYGFECPENLKQVKEYEYLKRDSQNN